MKKSILTLIISGMVLGTTILWIVEASSLRIIEYLQFVIIGIIIFFGIYVAYRRFTSEKRGLPAEDEFSKKVMQKAAALSYYISLYLWLAIMYLSDKLKAETDVVFGWGILGMAIIFAASWIYFNYKGVRDE